MRFINILFSSLFLTFSLNITAQVSEDSELFHTIFGLDSLLFEEGFNNCNLDIVQQILADELEFYHDQNGIQKKPMFLKIFKESLCSTPNRKPIRKLVQGSMDVFPLYNEGELYGAIQTAKHEFYIREPEKELYKTSVALFNHLWLLNENEWELNASLSYDHQVPKPDYGAAFDANYPAPLFDNDAEITKLLEQHNIPSTSIGYIENGKLKQIRSFGVQQDHIPISINSVYKVASLTKPISALIALKLVENGDFSLDESIAKYYVDADVKNHPYLEQLTIRQILSHQSGFPNWRHLTDSNTLDFEFEPGTTFQYSGEGFEYLRKAIEQKLQKPFEQIAEEILFTQLGMNNTSFYWSTKIDETDYAVEHDKNGNPIAFDKYNHANAAANLLTTINDYSKFLIHLMDGANLSNRLYSEFLKPQINQKKGIDRNLGMQLLSNLPDNKTVLMHTGGDYGIKTIMLAFPYSKKGLVIFSNSENGMVLWQKILTEYFGEIGEEIVKRNLE